MTINNAMPILGWREWIALPELGINAIKAKVDTGARTSVLHAFNVEPFMEKSVDKVRFSIHPIQRRTDKEIVCSADIVDQRWVTDSGGHKEKRYVISTAVTVGDRTWDIEMTLTNRDTMGFRVLLGRTALKNLYLVDPSASYLSREKPMLPV